jgi:glycosyltransferase involved in cell wall biosynthesis
VSTLALVGPSWPLRGGIARTTTALAAALSARGTLAGFFVPIRQYPGVLYPGRRDTDPNACPRLPEAQPCYHVLEPWTWGRLRRRLREAKPDALVLPYWTSAWAPLFWYLARAATTPVIAIVHNPTDHDGSWRTRSIARLTLGRCGGFLCHARHVADILERRFPGAAVVVHPLPPESPGLQDREAARARLGLRRDAVAALCFGLIRPYKGVDVLLEAVARLPDGLPVVLLLAGEPWGELAERLRRRVARADLAGRVVARLEWVPEADVPAWFAAADVAVLPYRSATGSAVAAQALGWGLPLVGSAVGGIAEVVEEGVNGLLVPPEDPEALAGALARIAQGSLRARLAEGARAASRSWNWSSYAEVLEELAARLVAPRSPGARDG